MKLGDVPLVIAIASGKGGVGKTTCASDIAREFTDRGYTTGLVDADISTPNTPEVLGGEEVDIGEQRLSDGDSMLPPKVNGIHLISKGHVLPDDVAILRGAQFRAETVLDYIENVEWPDDTDVVIFDTPPGTGEELQTIAAAVPLDHAFIVTTPHPSSIRDVRKTHKFFNQADVPHTALMNMAYIPSDMVVSHVTDDVDYDDVSGVGDATWETLVEVIGEQSSDFNLFGYTGADDVDLDVEITAVLPYSPDFVARRSGVADAVDYVAPEGEVENE